MKLLDLHVSKCVAAGLFAFKKFSIKCKSSFQGQRLSKTHLIDCPHLLKQNPDQCPRSSWAYRLGQGPRDSKSSRLHVEVIFRFCFHSFEVYCCVDSSRMIGNSLKVSNFNRLFLKLHRFICN